MRYHILGWKGSTKMVYPIRMYDNAYIIICGKTFTLLQTLNSNGIAQGREPLGKTDNTYYLLGVYLYVTRTNITLWGVR